MSASNSIAFFDTQFQRQVRESDFALNPFEQLALDYVAGTALDYGCGLGNLSLAAARRGCRVVAIDASPTAVERIRTAAAQEKQGATVAEVRKAYDARSAIDDLSSVKASDLEITKDGSDIVISFAYRKEIPLFKNLGLYIDFAAQSKE